MSDGKSEALEAMEGCCVGWPVDLTNTLRSLRDGIWHLEQFGFTANESRLTTARNHLGDATASLGKLMSERGL